MNKDSARLTVGSEGDLPEKADVVVAEIFDVGLFGEKAVNTLENARTHLLLVSPRGNAPDNAETTRGLS